MDTISDDFNLEEDSSNTQLASNDSAILSPNDSDIFMHSLLSSDSISEETYKRQLNDRVHELKAELSTRCQFDWLNTFEPSEHNPKVELNLLLHGAIRERTLRQLSLSKGLHFNNDEQIISEIFQNDYCLLQRIFQEIINDQREQRIIYTEILFRPDVFNFNNKNSSVKLKDVIEMIIDCIRFFASNQESNQGTKSLPVHIKILLSCNWNNIKNMNQFIRFARNYPNEIVGIDLYGQEDDGRKYWRDFNKYTKILRHYNIRYQASMNDYKDLQLISDVVTGLNIERLSEAYELILSSKYIENILVKHDIYLVICPLSNAYQEAKDVVLKIGKKRKHQSETLVNNPENEVISYNLMNYLQSELINYSITSFSPLQYKQNLSFIYKNLFESNKNSFTCEHMRWLNENALKSSFASQKLKSELIKYIRENYTNCYEHITLLKKFQETANKWQQEMNEIIDKNTQIAMEVAKKLREEKALKRLNHQQNIQTEVFEEDDPLE